MRWLQERDGRRHYGGELMSPDPPDSMQMAQLPVTDEAASALADFISMAADLEYVRESCTWLVENPDGSVPAHPCLSG